MWKPKKCRTQREKRWWFLEAWEVGKSEMSIKEYKVAVIRC